MKMKSLAIGDQLQNRHDQWTAILGRNADNEAAFRYAVKTTGIFCRPNCPSRLPKPENVVFFDSAAEALKAGFRPCKRCQPNGLSYPSELDARIARACKSLAEAEGSLPLKAVAKSVGMSPFHFHRLFRARIGVTPKQFQSSQRLTRFKHELRRVLDFLAAPQRGLSLPLDVPGTAFQQRVWTALQKIPVGQTMTYQDLARQLGAPKAVRAVARACAANKLAMAVPCHRVVRSNGTLAGYRWGMPRKRRLLDLESRNNSRVS
jgi:AraC family transcriptional regulator of adaptative response/methylated-DNA-[protein]-cysteine methyltransferase